jgi:hypothetical protein
MSTRNRILIIALVALWIGWPNQRTQARSSHVCSDACGSGASCDAECWLTQFDFDQDNPSTTCGDQGYSCCGDGWCDNAEGCNVCPDDCGYVSMCGTCTDNSQCESGEICASSHECIPYTPPQYVDDTPVCGGPCDNNGQCCGNDVCIGAPGQKYCGIPDHTYCPDSPPCSGTDTYGVSWENCNFEHFCGGSFPLDAYCDPGIDRCQFIAGPDCPDINYETLNVCVF